MVQDPSTALMGTLAAAGVLSLLLGLWYLWALARLFPRLGLPAWQGWVPVVNQWRLLERAGMPGWLVVLGFVSFGIVPLAALVIAAHRLNREVGAGAGMTVLAVLVAPLWAMLLAQRHPAGGRGAPAEPSIRVTELHRPVVQPAPGPDLPPTPAGLDSAWAPPAVHVSGPPPPPAWQAPPAPACPPDPAAARWVLEVDGREYPLGPDTIVGRSPAPIGRAAVVAIADSSRALSKSHARFRLTDAGWFVQDLGSTNGTVLIHPGGRHEDLRPHLEVPATEHLELGTLPAALRMG